MEALPKGLEEPPPIIIMTTVITHVSATIMKTRAESKQNQPSFKPFRFTRKALKRTNHSKEK